MENTDRPLKIFAMNDCDWWCHYSLEEAIEHFLHETGLDRDEVEDAHELDEEALERLIYWDSENTDPSAHEHWQCPVCGSMADVSCRWNGSAYEHPHPYPLGHVPMDNIHKLTFREVLARMTGPGFFATTEI